MKDWEYFKDFTEKQDKFDTYSEAINDKGLNRTGGIHIKWRNSWTKIN